jgi:hypothetical protein
MPYNIKTTILYLQLIPSYKPEAMMDKYASGVILIVSKENCGSKLPSIFFSPTQNNWKKENSLFRAARLYASN